MCEKTARIERPRRSFGVKLNGFHGEVAVAEPLVGAVVEVDHGLFERTGERPGVDGVAMIVRCNDDVSALQILYRLIAAAMPIR